MAIEMGKKYAERVKDLAHRLREGAAPLDDPGLNDEAADLIDEMQSALDLSRQSEKEGWRYSNELEQERKRLSAALDDAVAKERERCAVTAWNHYMDTCAAKKLHPSEHGHWLAASAIRAALSEEVKGGE